MILTALVPAAIMMSPISVQTSSATCAAQPVNTVMQNVEARDSGCVLIQELSNGWCLAICNGALSKIECDEI